MTDTSVADKVYMEPLTLEYLARICRYERPDAIIPGIGGQTGLNLAMQLEKKACSKRCGIEMLGTSAESIERGQRAFWCQQIGEPVLPSVIAYSAEEALEAAGKDRLPRYLRPAFTPAARAAALPTTADELREKMKNARPLPRPSGAHREEHQRATKK